MKTAISVPDDVFAQVEAAATRMGISRSAFFATAARRWLEVLDEQSVTEQIDAALEVAGEAPDDNAAFLRQAARANRSAGDEW
jgi:metal-responsive CopG/Arc/MetJ family transcriptional regulator